MATRVATKIKPDWSKIFQSIDKSEVTKMNKIKSQMDTTAIKIASLPESLPKIDWAHYKKHASNPKIVEEIEKQYAAIKVMVPTAPASRLNDLKVAREQDEARLKKFLAIAESYIESAEVVKQKFKDMLPMHQMSHEDYNLTFPEWSSSDINNPSCAPHYGRAAGLTREEAAAFDQPDPVPYSTPTAWKEWEEQKKKYYSN